MCRWTTRWRNCGIPCCSPACHRTRRSGVTGIPDDPAQLPVDDATDADQPPRRADHLPTVAQAYFTVVALFTPWSAGTLGLQIAAALIAIALTWLLAVHGSTLGRAVGLVTDRRSGSRQRRPRRRPRRTPHHSRRRHHRHADQNSPPYSSAPQAASSSSPSYSSPPSARRRPLIALGTFIASYVPHVLAVGTLVIGFLPGYLNQEGFEDGSSRSAILALLLPPEARQLVAACPRPRPRRPRLPPRPTRADRPHLLLAVRRGAADRHADVPVVRPPADRPRRTGRPARVDRRTGRRPTSPTRASATTPARA